jgi:hypothetical protein
MSRPWVTSFVSSRASTTELAPRADVTRAGFGGARPPVHRRQENADAFGALITDGNVRVFAACQGTQLMVIQHLRRHLQVPGCRDFLLWHPYENIPFIDRFMQPVISNAAFEDTLDIRGFQSLRKRTQSSLGWLIESPRRLRSDARSVRQWMQRNQILEDQIELWTDDPIHFYVNFSRGFFRRSGHVRIPHCFDQESALSVASGRFCKSKGRRHPPSHDVRFLRGNAALQAWTCDPSGSPMIGPIVSTVQSRR